ncbi:aldose epimerase family protein [Gorillibacterium timonense]|uniref:aldose epimerase family protein n=1 Tax=Gorillibacterium timonense TaxID=1689269 RepID=UPI00071CF962|nr:aldose epimerase [Gorillibacterium timonense]
MADYQVNAYRDTYEVYELTEESTGSRVTVCPERGGIVTGFASGGKELLYLDRDTFLDPNANIRGGIPILFPISGQLPEGMYEWEGAAYRIRNHGVVRNRPWQVVGTSTDGSASLTLRFVSDAGTEAEYPFAFELLFTYRLQDGKLRIEQEYINHSDRPLPFYAGLHPYFYATPGPVAYQTDATRLLDLNDGEEKPFAGTLDISEAKESVVLLNASEPSISFLPNGAGAIKLAYSPVFKYIVLWTAPGKPFLCVEPWMAKNEEMLRGEELVSVEPGSRLHAFVEIAAGRTAE